MNYMSTLIPNVMEFIGAGAAVKVKWDPKEAKLVDSEDREMSLLEAIPVLKDSCTHKELFGETPEEEAKIYQCVEWALRFGPDLQDEQTSSAAALKELNAILENRVYLTGHRFTLADVVMLHAVHGIVESGSSGPDQL
ncbi:eukaryotic translation elongation factor 1 epsilon-1-like [Tropilaelaps mercedesae]|uniref:Eukaryotic translation elongation factor 1 epsilon-1-like n=1 Tax=Tropilaelaps mercedesae TaxID=418985 RepID=A0A1V9XH65_9ACAR|nr:eukaryotic translation elongation factor 1 epsilon-1-like [Tropilaelaps mercedesae]